MIEVYNRLQWKVERDKKTPKLYKQIYCMTSQTRSASSACLSLFKWLGILISNLTSKSPFDPGLLLMGIPRPEILAWLEVDDNGE